jgi:polyphosphate kinase
VHYGDQRIMAMGSSAKTKRKTGRRQKSLASISYSLASDEFFHRELSWLSFNSRVLNQTEDPTVPLLEKLRFLTITTSNLDEFFMNRVAGLKDSEDPSRPATLTAELSQHLWRIRESVVEFSKRQDDNYRSLIKPGLFDNGIIVLSWSQLSKEEKRLAREHFIRHVFPVLTPQAIDPGHPFPAISNLSLSLGILLKHPERSDELFARIKVPSALPQLVRLNTERAEHLRVITLAELIQHNLELLFPGMLIEAVLPFRITRNAELNLDDYETDDLMQSVVEGLRERKFAAMVRLEHSPNPSPEILRFLLEEVGLTQDDAYASDCAIDFQALKELCDAPIPHLKYEPWSPVVLAPLHDEEANIFSVLRAQDILVHHPYESFVSSVERFLHSAVLDPKVLSIKMTLYRAGDNSSLIPLLVRAAEQDKQVVVLIEVKASMDEARNIRLAQQLEDAGVHVMYGVVGLKTHAKAILISRLEQDGIRCYAHLNTGNYNSTTARVYTDIGLFTASRAICDELVELFHYLTGRSLKRDYKELLVSPVNLKEALVDRIDREIDHSKAGRPGHIIIKANALEDSTICRALSKAATAGVSVDLIIRGVCCLKPVKGEHGQSVPRVLSIIGRFLEHSRIYYFRNGRDDLLDGEFWISSADPMYRNLHRRVEVAIPIHDAGCRQRCWEILTSALHDMSGSWELNPDGTYTARRVERGELAIPSQQLLMKLARDRSRNT